MRALLCIGQAAFLLLRYSTNNQLAKPKRWITQNNRAEFNPKAKK